LLSPLYDAVIVFVPDVVNVGWKNAVSDAP
jgi:hypothetical protein